MATRTLKSTGGNWSSTGTWVEAAVPTSSDAVVCPAGAGQLTIDTSGCVCNSIDFTGYTNTLTCNGVNILQISGGATTFVNTMSFSGNGIIQTYANSGTQTFTTGGVSIPQSIKTLWSNGTVNFVGDITCTGLNIAAAQVYNGGTIYCSGNLTYTGNVTGTASLVLNGTGTWSCTASTTQFGLNTTINTSGTITFGFYATFGMTGANRTLTYIAGTVDKGTGTFYPVGTAVTLSMSNGSNYMQFNNFYANVMTQTITLTSHAHVYGTTSVYQGTTINGAYNWYTGGLTQAGNFGGTATLVFNGTGTWTTSSGQLNPSMAVVINTAGTLTFGTRTGLNDGGSLTYTAGTVVLGTGTFSVAGNVTLNMNGQRLYTLATTAAYTITLGSNLTLTSQLSVTYNITFAGAYDISCQTLYLPLSKTLTIPAGRTLTVTTYIQAASDGVVNNTIIQSGTASTTAYFVFSGSSANARIFGIYWTDINATGSAQGIDNWYGGTLTRCSGITNRTSADIGGGGSTTYDVFGIM